MLTKKQSGVIEKVILPHEESLSKREFNNSTLSFDIVDLSGVMPQNLDRAFNSSEFDLTTSSGHNSSQINNKMKNDIFIKSGMSQIPSLASSGSLYSPTSCAICIDRYSKGDEIAWSFNEKCHHAFHLDCILDWLMKHDECPLCRMDYLNLGNSSEV